MPPVSRQAPAPNTEFITAWTRARPMSSASAWLVASASKAIPPASAARIPTTPPPWTAGALRAPRRLLQGVRQTALT